MKRITLLVSFLAIGVIAGAQTVLTYQTHGLIPDNTNPMKLTKYIDPGTSGRNVIWDFTSLEATNDFVGSIQETYVTKGCFKYSNSNTVLEEFGNYFIFKGNNNSLEQYGMMSSNGNSYIMYSKPFVKMKYPFTFNSSFNGTFEGASYVEEKKVSDIAGEFTVTGDGIGKLLLPDGKSFNNTLRVKEVKSFDQVTNGNKVHIEDVTYRWYVNNHRFPILVFIKSTFSYENGKSSFATKAAYNSNVIALSNEDIALDNPFKLTLYPNPYKEKLNITYSIETTAEVNISVYDITGKQLQVLVNKTEDPGEKTLTFSAKDLGLPSGAYLIKFRANDREISRKVLEL